MSFAVARHRPDESLYLVREVNRFWNELKERSA